MRGTVAKRLRRQAASETAKTPAGRKKHYKKLKRLHKAAIPTAKPMAH